MEEKTTAHLFYMLASSTSRPRRSPDGILGITIEISTTGHISDMRVKRCVTVHVRKATIMFTAELHSAGKMVA